MKPKTKKPQPCSKLEALSAGLQAKNSTKKAPWGKPFQPGQSGNPSGRPKGSVSPTAALRRSLTRRDVEAIALTVIRKAKAGDQACLRILFDRLDHPLSGPMAIALAQASPMVGHEVHLHLVDNHRDVPPVSIVLPKGRMALDEAQAAARQQHADLVNSATAEPVISPQPAQAGPDPVQSEAADPPKQEEPESIPEQAARQQRINGHGKHGSGLLY